MKITFKKQLFSKTGVAACVLAATTATSMSVSAAAEDTTVDVSFRYRIETVDMGALDAVASTLRTRATIKTNWTSRIETVIELDDVSTIGLDGYNAGAGNSPGSKDAVVADPVGTEVNQSFIRYNGDKYKLAFGRQRVLLGNQRFVGGVGWRQNEQTYDSFTWKAKFTDKLDFNLAYVFNVNRIFGEAVDAGDHKHNTLLADMNYKLGSGKLSGYFFSIDNETAPGLSNDTIGIRYSGKIDSFKYTLEFASQSGAGDNPNNYDANYYLLDAKYAINNITLGGGLEVLGGDQANGQGFTTSLATLHKFQGWADVFLGTPPAGIEDMYLDASTKAGGFNFKVIYHDFDTDQGGTDLGSEIDFAVSKKFTNKFSGLLKLASYSAPTGGTDRDKIWLMLTYKL